MARGRRRGRASPARARPSHKPPKRSRYFFRSRRRRDALLGGLHPGRRYWVPDEDYRNRMNVLKRREDAKALKVSSVDLHKESNREAHNTNEYELEDLIVRRGKGFTLSITFDRAIKKDGDTIVLQFSTGARPQESKGTIIRLPVNAKTKPIGGPRNWSISSTDIKGSTLKVTVVPAPNAIIGTYELFVEAKVTGNDEKKISRFELEDEDIYILFNSWCSDDDVHMPDESARKEYVLNEKGRIWVGSAGINTGRPWNFGQFDNPVLEAAMRLLDMSEIGDSARRSPVSVVRALSALVNSNDDNGVLEGRWTETYPKDSTVPWAWIGSVAILKEFMEKGKPVRYGQCWVFSAVLTTLLRALGVPTRSVTNFESAHDTDGSMTIDKHWDMEGEPCSWLDDSVWNFHVWNESFFRRLDLPDGYGGWQAIDATPQEVSEGVMRCGPASIKAIKEGHVYLNYDTAFVFSEVNGDKVQWRVDEDESMTVLNINTRAVGKFISTKSKGNPLREDVTNHYKYPEGSEKERKSVEFANRFSSRRNEDIYNLNEKKDVDFTLNVPESSMVGDDLVLSVVIKNNSPSARSIQGRLSVVSSYYTGVPAKRLKGDKSSFKIQPRQQEKVILKLAAKEYQAKLNPETSFITYAMFTVTETGQAFAAQEAFSLKKPELNIKVPSNIPLKKMTKVTVSFTNPLGIILTDGTFHLEGASVMGSSIYELKKPIGPSETISYEFQINPRKKGTREVQANFSSQQLSGVDGSAEFEVR